MRAHLFWDVEWLSFTSGAPRTIVYLKSCIIIYIYIYIITNYIILLYLYAYLFDCEMCQYTYSINDVKMVKPVHLSRSLELLFIQKNTAANTQDFRPRCWTASRIWLMMGINFSISPPSNRWSYHVTRLRWRLLFVAKWWLVVGLPWSNKIWPDCSEVSFTQARTRVLRVPVACRWLLNFLAIQCRWTPKSCFLIDSPPVIWGCKVHDSRMNGPFPHKDFFYLSPSRGVFVVLRSSVLLREKGW